MATPTTSDEVKKVDPPVQLLECVHMTVPLSPDDYGDIVTVITGQPSAERKFYVYEGLLIHYSAYFRNALKKEWIHGTPKTVTLLMEDPEVFHAFFHWMFTKKLYSHLTSEGGIPLETGLICAIYVFGDARGIPELCNAAVDLLFQKVAQDWICPSGDVAYVYDNTMEGSRLRACLVDHAVDKYNFVDLKKRVSRCPREFLVDITENFRDKITTISSVRSVGTRTYVAARTAEICSKYHDRATS